MAGLHHGRRKKNPPEIFAIFIDKATFSRVIMLKHISVGFAMPAIILKELRDLLFSSKFLFLLVASSILIFVSVFHGAFIYQVEYAEAMEMQKRDDYSAANSYQYRYLRSTHSRFPTKLSIFDPGISGFIGRDAWIAASSPEPLVNNNHYSDDPVLALFGHLSLGTVTGAILSLFALLLSYNAISGEKESGTLRLMLANPVRRSSVILGKMIGGLVPLLLLYLGPLLLALLGLITFTDLRFSGEEWLRIAAIVAIGCLYLALFHGIGLAASALTRRSFVSFLICLIVWMLSIAILPRIALQAAAQISPSQPMTEYARQRRAVSDQEMKERMSALARFWSQTRVTPDKMREKNQEFRDWWDREQAPRFKKMRLEIARAFRLRRDALTATGIAVSRISPSAVYSFASHPFTGTGPHMLRQYEEQLRRYHEALTTYALAKSAEYDNREQPRQEPHYRFEAGPDGNARVVITGPEPEQPKLDVSDMPKFSITEPPLSAHINDALPDLALLIGETIAVFALAFVAFLRYDAR